jgi:hypothetical protein
MGLGYLSVLGLNARPSGDGSTTISPVGAPISKFMTERHFIAGLSLMAFVVFGLNPTFATLGGLFVTISLYALRLGLAYEKDCRLKALRDDMEKQLTVIRDKVDGLLFRGQR